MSKNAWTSPEVAHIIGVPPRTVTIWAERGYITPSIEDANGRGSKRLWSKEDIVMAAAVRECVGVFSPGILREWSRRGFRPSRKIEGHVWLGVDLSALCAEVNAATE